MKTDRSKPDTVHSKSTCMLKAPLKVWFSSLKPQSFVGQPVQHVKWLFLFCFLVKDAPSLL